MSAQAAQIYDARGFPIVTTEMVEQIAQGKHPKLEQDLVQLARRGELKGVVKKPPRFSATTIQNYSDCARKFYWAYVAGLDEMPSDAQAFGTELHRQAEFWLKEGRVPLKHTKQGQLLDLGLPLLPPPRAKGLAVEEPFNVKFKGVPVSITGTIDFHRAPQPDAPHLFVLGDHKTARSTRYPKTKNWLSENIQSNLYAKVLIDRWRKIGHEITLVDKQWIYYFKDEKQASKLRVVQDVDEVEGHFANTIVPHVLGMAKLVADAPKVTDIPAADRSVCEMYKGCPHLGRCFGMGAREQSIMGVGSSAFSKAGIAAKAQELHTKVKDLTGRKFGRLTVIARGEPPTNANRNALWDVECSCGEKKTLPSRALLDDGIISCGCARVDANVTKNTTHGLSNLPEHNVWESMHQRCSNANNKDYKYYGGRGIEVCERWNDFESFYKDMGARPTEKHTIDRINNDGGYEPGNCRWATMAEQNANKRGRKGSLVMGVLSGGFSKSNIAGKAAAIRGAGTAVNPPKPRVVPPPEEDEVPAEMTEEDVQAEVEVQEAETPKPKKTTKKAAKAAPVEEEATQEDEAPAPRATRKGASRTSPGYNSKHDFWLFVGCMPAKGFEAELVAIEEIVGSAQSSAAQSLGTDHYRQGNSYGVLEAAFATWMEENAVNGAIYVADPTTLAARDVIGLLRAHASVVIGRVQ